MPNKNSRTRKNTNSSDNECCNATFDGIHHWYVEMYEKLGWMVLAKKRGMTDKTNVYKHSLHRLLHSIENKMRYMKDVDKKQDLKIMHENVKILCEHAEKDL